MKNNIKKRICLFLIITCAILAALSFLSLHVEQAYALDIDDTCLDKEGKQVITTLGNSDRNNQEI